MKNDPKMQVFFDEANRLMTSRRCFKDIFNIQIETWSKRTLFIFEDEKNRCVKIRYRDYEHICYQYAFVLKNKLANISRDSFIAIKMNNSPKWAYVFWGLIIAGYSPLLINPIMMSSDTNRLILEGGVKAVISDKDEQLDVENININSLKLSEEFKGEEFGHKVAFCTSGTTGNSRIFVFNEENMVHQIYAAYSMPDTTDTIMYQKPDVRLVSIVPFAHIFGFVANFLWFSFFGRTFVFTKSLAPEEISRMCKKYGVSHIFTVPLFWDRVAKSFYDGVQKQSQKRQNLIEKFIAYNNGEISKTEAGLASTKLVKNKIQKSVLGNKVIHCISGGSALSKDTLRTINGIGYPLYNGYGMSEIGITSVELSPKVSMRNKSSVGKPLFGVEYKINNGELLVKSPQIHSEMLINGKLEKADIDADGFFHTGDIASFDEDGNTYIRGKLKDVIISSNGENIYPDEIENKFKDVAGISELSVFGLKQGETEKLAMAIYVPRKLNNDEVKEFENNIAQANSRLPIAMQVQEFYLSFAPLPTNASMKVMRYKLIDDLTHRPEMFVRLNHGNIVSFEGYDEKEVKKVAEHVRDIISDILNVPTDKIADSDHVILDLGGDSFTYMSIIASIESEFDIKISTDSIGRLNTVNDFSLYILENQQSK